jgi:hypothetical protein
MVIEGDVKWVGSEASGGVRRRGWCSYLMGFEGAGLRGSIYLVEGMCQSKYQSLTKLKESTIGSLDVAKQEGDEGLVLSFSYELC